MRDIEVLGHLADHVRKHDVRLRGLLARHDASVDEQDAGAGRGYEPLNGGDDGGRCDVGRRVGQHHVDDDGRRGLDRDDDGRGRYGRRGCHDGRGEQRADSGDRPPSGVVFGGDGVR